MAANQSANWGNLSVWFILVKKQWMVISISVYKCYGIYGIRNKINNKIYVSKTMQSFGDRWDCHRAMLRAGYHENPHLQNAWNKYGENNFEFIVIHNCENNETVEQVDELEISEIAKYKELDLAYNIHDGGSGGMFLGKHLSEETKRKIGEKNRINMLGKKASEETKAKMSESQSRRFSEWTDEDRVKWGEKMSLVNKGRKWDDESRQKMIGNKNGAKYTIDDVREIRRLHEQENKSYAEISELTGIPSKSVYLIATYRRWKDSV